MSHDPLAEAVQRWRKPSSEAIRELHVFGQRLDDKGCAYGRVTSARLDDLARAFERLEAKLNAILLAVTGTFVSTLIGLLLFYLRG